MVDLGALYLETGDIPWVVGLSGGKDSTALTMHLLETMEQLPPPIRNQKRVFIMCVNTLVEAPPVIDHVHKFIERLQLYIEDCGLPVEVVELVPTASNVLVEPYWARLPYALSRVQMVHRPYENTACKSIHRRAC